DPGGCRGSGGGARLLPLPTPRTGAASGRGRLDRRGARRSRMNRRRVLRVGPRWWIRVDVPEDGVERVVRGSLRHRRMGARGLMTPHRARQSPVALLWARRGGWGVSRCLDGELLRRWGGVGGGHVRSSAPALVTPRR